MQPKILLLALSAAAFSSCSTAYKSGQTPDDVYYSPAKIADNEQNNERREEVRYEPAVDYQISMGIRDRRWRDFGDDYDYNNSPYYYTCKNHNYGYYYNPYYYPRAIYTGYSKPVNTTPRMVNLASYNGYNSKLANDKTFNSNSGRPSSQYNNSNSRVGNLIREVITPSNSNSSSNSSRTYTPSTSNSSSSGSSSSGSSSSGSVSRPGRGN